MAGGHARPSREAKARQRSTHDRKGKSGSGEEGPEREGAGNGFGPDISQSGPMKPVVHTHR
jgi:hypothetical protein